MDLSSYNPEQRKCILTTDNDLQAVACAGSGKTRTIVGRSAYLVEQKLALPSEMVAITFTVKAANEMKERIYSYFETEFGSTLGLAEMYIGTIHGFCLNQIQKFVPEYKKYEIITDVQRTLLVKRRLDQSLIFDIPYYKKGKKKGEYELGKPLQGYVLSDIGLVLDTIDFAINELLDVSTLDSSLQEFYNKYTELLNARSMLDFAHVQKAYYDQLSVNEALQEQVKSLKYITVDEYQDTNTIQEAIILKMKEINPRLNVCVVGDDDQTLYEWRGSNLSVFKNFTSKFPNAKTIKLTTNYRSSVGVVKIGESVARSIPSSNRVDKEFKCSNSFQYERGDIVAQTNFPNINSENDFIINSILKLKGSKLTKSDGTETTIDYHDMAILVDSTKNLRKFNPQLLQLLEKNNIDYIIDGTKQLFETKEIQTISDLFLLFATEFCELQQSARIAFYDESFVRKLRSYSPINAIFAKYSINLMDRYENTLQQFFLDLIEMCDFKKYNEPTREKILYNYAVFTEIITDFEKIYFLDEFGSRIKEFVRFLSYDAKEEMYPEGWLSPKFTETKSLKIMTIYSAKGLEFPVVFMPHLCRNFMFPSQPGKGKSKEGILRYADDSVQHKLENYGKNEDSYARLFYVAVTRSMKYLFMTKSVEYTKVAGTTIYKDMTNQLRYIFSSAHYVADGDIFLARDLEYVKGNDAVLGQLVFDFSTLQDIFECPKKFQFSSIFGFNTPLNVRMGYGRSLHNMLEDLHTSYLESQIIKDYDALRIHMYLPLAPREGDLYKSMHASAKKIIDEYTEINRPLFDSVEYIEAPIDYKLNDLVFINGRVDLIVNAESGDIKIIDFKSDSGTLSPDLRKKQLLIYALGYHKLTGNYPTSVVSYNLRDNQPHESAVKSEDLKAVEQQINAAYYMIKSKNYPKCHNAAFCSECTFKKICAKIE